MRRSVLIKVLAPSLTGCFLLGLVGCTTTDGVKTDQQSGFLGGYTKMERGVGKEDNYVYINRAADWAKYTKIWLKPIELWHSSDPESPLGRMSEESQVMLANTLYAAMYDALKKNHQMVDQAGPDVLVVHAALTDGRRSQKVPEPGLSRLSSIEGGEL